MSAVTQHNGFGGGIGRSARIVDNRIRNIELAWRFGISIPVSGCMRHILLRIPGLSADREIVGTRLEIAHAITAIGPRSSESGWNHRTKPFYNSVAQRLYPRVRYRLAILIGNDAGDG